jgi:hypothetical protein
VDIGSGVAVSVVQVVCWSEAASQRLVAVLFVKCITAETQRKCAIRGRGERDRQPGSWR